MTDEQEPASVCPYCGAAETYRKTHKDGRSTVVYACDTSLSVSGKHHRSKACMQAEIERLKTIVRVRTHREHGCICERCVESEHDVARVVAALRAELDAVRARRKDDAEPLTTEWLRNQSRQVMQHEWTLDGISNNDLVISRSQSGYHARLVPHETWLYLGKPKTRGDVRRLLAALKPADAGGEATQ